MSTEQLSCPKCEWPKAWVCTGACTRPPTVDEAMTALAVARTQQDRLAAYEALAAAAQLQASRLREALVIIAEVTKAK